jgi:hypothetical protein
MGNTSAGNESDSGPTKPCSTCHEPIHPKARKCKVCETYQDWRRYLQVSSLVLALLVALVSVVGWTAPVVVTALTEQNSHMEAYFQALANNRAFIMVTNTGVRPGSVISVRLVARDPGENVFHQEREYFHLEPIVVRAGESNQITLDLAGAPRCYLDQATAFLWEDTAPHVVPSFLVRVRDFRGGQVAIRFDPELVDILRSGGPDWHACAARIVQEIGSEPTAALTQAVRRECDRPPEGTRSGGGSSCW